MTADHHRDERARAGPGPPCGRLPRRSCRFLSAGHRGAEVLRGHGLRVELADQLTAEDDLDPVGQADQLVEVGRDQQHAEPLAAGPLDVVPDRGLGADVDAAGRVRGDQQDRVAAHLAADDQLLLVAAGQGAGGGVDRRACGRRTRSTIRSVSALAPAPVDQPVLARGRQGLVAEDAVLPERRVEQQAVVVAVLGDEADAGLAALPGGPAAHVGVVEGRSLPDALAACP